AEAELERRGWLGCRRAEARPATLEQITAVHPQAYVDALRTAAERRLPFGSETAVTDESLATALYAAGGACALAEALLGGDAPTGFSLMRPPITPTASAPRASACSTPSPSRLATRSTASAPSGSSSSTGTSTTETGRTRSSATPTRCCSPPSTRPGSIPAPARSATRGRGRGRGTRSTC